MANSNNVITSPVNLRSDVASVLGTSETNVSGLCTSHEINMWSRCKPVHIASAAPDRSMPSDGEGAWWKGSMRNCGIKPPPVASYEEIPKLYTGNKMNGYIYERPWGGSGSPYRLADFLLYKHDAQPPFHSFYCDSKVSMYGSISCSLARNVTTADKSGPGSVELSDIESATNLDTWWFGAMLVDSSNRIVRKLANVRAGVTLEMPANGLTLGQYYDVYPFFCMNKIESIIEADKANLFLPVMNCSPGRVKYVSEEEAGGLVINLTAEYVTNSMTGLNTAVKWNLKLTYYSVGTKTLTNNWITLRRVVSDEDMGREKLQDFNLIQDREVEIFGTFSLSDFLGEYYVYLQLNTNEYTKKAYPLKLDPNPGPIQ